jgi:anti-sigma regulatory factor (Ser/Thr protein kinase)
MPEPVELRVPARAEHLALVRAVVTALAGTEAGLGPDRLDDLQLAVTEACANAIEAYHRLGVVGVVAVRCWAVPGSIVVEIADRAGGFDVGAVGELPDPERPERLHHEHGLGIALMRTLADDAEIVAGDGGTTVRLRFGQPVGARP